MHGNIAIAPQSLCLLPLMALIATLSLPALALAQKVTPVYVAKVDGDRALVVRSNEEVHLIDKGVGCYSLGSFEGKVVFISSPGLFLGVGSKLLIPERDQECRIWNSEYLGSVSDLATAQGGGQAGCDDGHWLQSVSSDGEIIKLEDGSIWEVDPIDTIYSALWLPTEDIMVCSYQLINMDNGEKVAATRIR